MWSERTIGKAFRYVVEHVYLSTTCLHLLVLFYGLLQDRFNLSVKFTDIDYMVFTDAAKAVLQGKSPYTRHTYRYTPLLAYITSINIIFKMEILSKLLFCAVNILSGKILEWLLILLDVDNDTKIKGSVTLRRFLISTWLLNPFPVVIAARGSADVIPSILVLITIYFLMKAKYDSFNNKMNIIISAFFFGLSVHFKLYPVIYGFPFIFFINPNYLKKDRPLLRSPCVQLRLQDSPVYSLHPPNVPGRIVRNLSGQRGRVYNGDLLPDCPVCGLQQGLHVPVLPLVVYPLPACPQSLPNQQHCTA
ncbi:PIG-M mannosyltransferase [Cryptosporidium canis]|uniref:GPI mannosyltransferase 1 n=1 Tax=Cryptosporidium canis TaxID=195482 RepID=A0A9D5DEV7_9CRYT|nr:PIG-M mannosyltransferase [Cryptosporidium canis]